MIRRICASLAIAALLSACGGGGGGGSAPVVPKAPSQGLGKATFTFKIPGKATLAKVHRPLYVSQNTAGVGIDWMSTDPTHPDYAAPITAACPGTLPAGVTACSVDSQGGTDYTFQLQIPFGTYTITVSTFDTAPSAGVFTGNLLAQGQLAAPVAISAGQANTIPSLTFYGVPAAVSFVPAASQSHVAPYSNGTVNGYAIVGNTPQTFYAQSTDADGFAIGSSDPGAPAMSVAESAGDSPQYVHVASTANKYAFTLTALQAPAGATTMASIVVTATPGGTGLSAATGSFNVLPVQELWTTQTAGGSASSYGLNGYALYPPNYTPTAPLDFTFDPTPNALCSGVNACAFEPAAAFADGSIAAIGVSAAPPAIFKFTAPSGSLPPALPAAALAPALLYPSNIAIDTAGHMFVTDNTVGTLSAYVGASTAAAQATGLTAPVGLAVAPSGIASIAALAQTIWVGDGSATPIHVYTFNGTSLVQATLTIADSQPPTNVNTLGFDSNGYLWAFDGSYLHVYAVTGSLSTTISLTELQAADYQPTNGLAGSSFGATGQGTMWIGSFGSYQYETPLSLTGCPGASCAVVQGSYSYFNAPVDASIVVP